MHEAFQLDGGILRFIGDFADFGQRKLTRQHDAGKTETGEQLRAGRGVDGHLCGRVEVQVRAADAEHPDEAGVLDDDGVDRQRTGVPDEVEGGGKLVLPEQRIDGQIQLDTACVAVVCGLFQLRVVEVMRVCAR